MKGGWVIIFALIKSCLGWEEALWGSSTTPQMVSLLSTVQRSGVLHSGAVSHGRPPHSQASTQCPPLPPRRQATSTTGSMRSTVRCSGPRRRWPRTGRQCWCVDRTEGGLGHLLLSVYSVHFHSSLPIDVWLGEVDLRLPSLPASTGDHRGGDIRRPSFPSSFSIDI